MQTFLPYPNFEQCAQVLDNKRLGKQRVEVLQILRTLTGQSQGWQNHPAVKMWRGYEWALAEYGSEICVEWSRRGFQDTCYDKIMEIQDGHTDSFTSQPPPWLGDIAFHASHRACLLGKDPEWYSRWGWHKEPAMKGEDGKWPYVWPVK